MLKNFSIEHNRLLNALPPSIQACISPHLEVCKLLLGEVLSESGQTLQHVYFPIDVIVSLLYVMENGASAEISVVGNDGFIGMSVFLGGDSTLSRSVVQSEGHAFRLSAEKFKTEVYKHAIMLKLILRYTQALFTQIAQTAACNRHHCIHQQLCRWLLLSLDRLPNNHLNMSQELISNMLGVRREGVTEAASKLKKLGVIKYCRGHITIVDRKELESLCCECYVAVKKETDRLLPQPD